MNKGMGIKEFKRFGEIIKGICVICGKKQITDGFMICNDCKLSCEVCKEIHKH